jgi:hypothetical protein
MNDSSVLSDLARRERAPNVELVLRDGSVAFPFHWQVPAATEKAAYESILESVKRRDFDYLGFPWATIIDGLRGNAPVAAKILMALKDASGFFATGGRRRVTVAQHIHAMQFVDLFKVCGITDVFWSHATRDQFEVDGIRLHPFPLFPAQTPAAVPRNEGSRPRRYLANFIGAYNPNLYLTNVREVIFNDQNQSGDLLIVKRDAWHFDRAVYREQIKGVRPDESSMSMEQRKTEEYLTAISDSWFTLCPSGSGPNSIRIFESLCLGSIPIVLTRDLRLPGPTSLWRRAAVIEDDSAAGFSRAIAFSRSMSSGARVTMLKAGEELFQIVGPKSFGELINDSMAGRY